MFFLSFPVTIRLTPILPTKVAMAQFRNVEDAVSAVQDILRTPHGMQLRTQNFFPFPTHYVLTMQTFRVH